MSKELIETLSGEIELDLPEFDSPPENPLRLLERWLETADEQGVREPRALALATVDGEGKPSSRTVLLKQVTPALVFTSHHESRKGHQIAATPWAAGTLYWRETTQQVTMEGRVEKMSDEESDRLFAERPRAAQAVTVVSSQSAPLPDPEILRKAAAELAAGEEPLWRPVGWGGYRFAPLRIEFWHGRSDRVHQRLLYARGGKSWSHQRLQP